MRVIAGRLGGRRLDAPPGRDTRPTSDRVREAIFSILADVTGARVLDLYAGTGALGIEALSRGAERAVFVESGPRALAVLKKNLAALALEPASKVLAVRAERAVTAIAADGPFDLVLIDPPYADVAAAAKVAAALVEKGALAEGARIVLEHASGERGVEIPGTSIVSERRYGDTGVTLYQVGSGA
jgi:16S rRNA (guanine966-N2)-methyltransferase